MTRLKVLSLAPLLVGMALLGASFVEGCGGSDAPSQFGNGADKDASAGRGDGSSGGNSSSGTLLPDDGDGSAPPPGCVNLECKQVQCSGAAKTTVTGKVYDPSGRLPLYNAIVYVPNGQVEAFKPGVTCDKCGAVASGSPLVSAITAPDGSFTLENVPVGDDIPLVLQVGRWRRQVKLPKVAACTANPVTDVNILRLPRTKQEGDIPQMAIASGSADPFECLLRKIGIADSEFTSNTGNGRVHFHKQNGRDLSPAAPNGNALWGSLANLKKYDLVFLPCEGDENKKDAAHTQNVIDYTSAGGRIFTTHYSYVWTAFAQNPFPTTGKWTPETGSKDAFITANIDRSFPKGQAFAEWLMHVKASTTLGDIQLKETRHDLSEAYKPPSQRWMSTTAYNTVPNGPPESVQHITFNTPINAPLDDAGAPLECGKVVFSDFHVSADALVDPQASSSTRLPFPASCKNEDYTAQEKALAFMIFDLSACVQNEDKKPEPPAIPR